MNDLELQILSRKSYDNESLSDAYRGIISVFSSDFSRSKSYDLHDFFSPLLSFFKIKNIDEGLSHILVGNDFEIIDRFCDKYNLIYREVSLKKGWYKDAGGAYIGKLKNGKYVVLLPNALHQYVYFDPNTGERIKINKKNEDILSEDAIMFYNAFPKRKINIFDLLKYISNLVPLFSYIEIIIFNIIAVTIIVYIPTINSYLFNYVVPNKDAKAFLSLFIIAISFIINSKVFEMVKNMSIEKNSMFINSAVEVATMGRILSLENRFYLKFSTGELASIISYAKLTLSSFFSSVVLCLISLFNSIIYINNTKYYSVDLVIPSIISILTIGTFMIISSIVKINYERKIIGLQTKFQGTEYAMLNGIQKIKLAGAEKRFFSKWLTGFTNVVRLKCNIPFVLCQNNVIVFVITLVFTLVFEIFAYNEKIKQGNYFAFLTAYGLATSSVTILIKSILSIAELKPSYDIIKPIFSAEPECSENKPKLTAFNGDIDISHIKFRYNDNSPYVLNDFSLKINSGEYVAIVGKTGCGKSTIVKLLLGFEKPISGAIYYSKNDILKTDIKSIRENIGTVIQNGKLFTGTIFSNIVVASKNPTEESAWEAAKIACIDEDIKSMPMGMKTIVSDGVGTISGGQKQRILIARALVNKPKVLVFDEASSALDNITQKKVFDSIAELKCTRLVIAHRLSTIKHCDRIVYLEDGKVAESGSFDELVAKKGKFYEMLQNDNIINKTLKK